MGYRMAKEKHVAFSFRGVLKFGFACLAAGVILIYFYLDITTLSIKWILCPLWAVICCMVLWGRSMITRLPVVVKYPTFLTWWLLSILPLFVGPHLLSDWNHEASYGLFLTVHGGVTLFSGILAYERRKGHPRHEVE